MMKVTFRRPRGFNSLGRQFEKKVKDYFYLKIAFALRQMQEAIMQTPVYTGRTLVNYHWSLNGPVTSTRSAVKEGGLPGKTSEMELGSEPRRSANAAVVQQEFQTLLAGLKANPFQSVYLTNTTPYFMEVEYGTYTAKTSRESRTPPGGMVRRGETAVRYALEGLIRVG